MGLSRNKVAVSEGAAGSPPFYGDNAGNPKENRPDEIETKSANLTKGARQNTDELAK